MAASLVAERRARVHLRDRRETFAEREARLEAEADRLLAKAGRGANSEEYPYHRANWWRKKWRKLGGEISDWMPERGSGTQAQGRQLDKLVRITRLSAGEAAVLELRRAGRSQTEIGRVLGVSTSAVGNSLRRAIEKLRERAQEPMRLTESEQIAEVYWEEVHRAVYRPPTCCPPGQEACRKTGLCDRRWYLFVDRLE